MSDSCPQPGGEAVADRDKSDRCQGDTPSSGERLRDVGQAGRSGGESPILPSDTKYRTIVADPPWRYAAAATKADASKRYATMSLGEIMALRDAVTGLAAPDAHLWLWTTNAFIEEGYDVVRAWGFRPLTLLTWCKKQPGVGHYLRNNTEHAVLASRGSPLVPADKAMASWYVWPRGEHSVKPDAFYDLVEQVSPGPYLEMFSRRARLGWDTWGDEALHGTELVA